MRLAASNVRRRDALGLPLSARHGDILHGTSSTVSEAVNDFIETYEEASHTANGTIKRLKRNADGQVAAQQLSDCRHDSKNRTRSNCNICALYYRRLIVPQAVAYQQFGVPASAVTVLIREVPQGEIAAINLFLERDALRQRLKRSGFQACIGNMEVAYKPERQTWSLHAHLLVFGPCADACALLAERIKLPRSVHHAPIRASCRVRQITYLFKFTTYYRHPSSPRVYPLPDERLVELANWRLRLSLADHLVLLGFQRRGAILPGPGFHRMLGRNYK